MWCGHGMLSQHTSVIACHRHHTLNTASCCKQVSVHACSNPSNHTTPAAVRTPQPRTMLKSPLKWLWSSHLRKWIPVDVDVRCGGVECMGLRAEAFQQKAGQVAAGV